jgi:hypothetical protein
MNPYKMDIQEKNEVVESNSEETTKKTIVFCVTGNTFSEKFLRNWTEIFGYCLMNNMQPILSNFSGNNSYLLKNGCMLGQNGSTEEQLPFKGKINYDYVVFMDTKHLLPLAHFKALLEANKDVITSASSNEFSMEQMNFIQTVDFTNPSNYEYEKREELEELKKESKLLKVDFIQCGVLLIKNGVFEKIQFPWFDFDQGTHDLKGDVHFCRKCKERGIDIFVDLEHMCAIERIVLA